MRTRRGTAPERARTSDKLERFEPSEEAKAHEPPTSTRWARTSAARSSATPTAPRRKSQIMFFVAVATVVVVIVGGWPWRSHSSTSPRAHYPDKAPWSSDREQSGPRPEQPLRRARQSLSAPPPTAPVAPCRREGPSNPAVASRASPRAARATPREQGSAEQGDGGLAACRAHPSASRSPLQQRPPGYATSPPRARHAAPRNRARAGGRAPARLVGEPRTGLSTSFSSRRSSRGPWIAETCSGSPAARAEQPDQHRDVADTARGRSRAVRIGDAPPRAPLRRSAATLAAAGSSPAPASREPRAPRPVRGPGIRSRRSALGPAHSIVVDPAAVRERAAASRPDRLVLGGLAPHVGLGDLLRAPLAPACVLGLDHLLRRRRPRSGPRPQASGSASSR